MAKVFLLVITCLKLIKLNTKDTWAYYWLCLSYNRK